MEPVNFSHPIKPIVYLHLHDALTAYSWPHKKSTIHYPTGDVVLPAGSNLERNTHELNTMSAQLNAALSDGANKTFADWASCVMEWGGVAGSVIKKKGNNYWISQNANNICQTVTDVNDWIALQNDDTATVPDTLRFNAGMTKLYSLLGNNPNFVIYDSRVAAALAWLVSNWSAAISAPVPDALAFGCLPFRIPKKPQRPNKRNPDPTVFDQIDNMPCDHLQWNVRASWVLEESFRRAKANTPHIAFANIREIEAALFMIGADLP